MYRQRLCALVMALVAVSTFGTAALVVAAAPAFADTSCISAGSASLDSLGQNNDVAQCNDTTVTWTSKKTSSSVLKNGTVVVKGANGIGYYPHCGSRSGPWPSLRGMTTTCGSGASAPATGAGAAPPAKGSSPGAAAPAAARPDTSDYACMGIPNLSSARIRQIQEYLVKRHHKIDADGYASYGGQTCVHAVQEANFDPGTKTFIEGVVSGQYPVSDTPPPVPYDPGPAQDPGPSTADNVQHHIEKVGVISAICLAGALIGAAFTFGTQLLLIPVLAAPICAIGGSAATW
jgi:hypothetical protein